MSDAHGDAKSELVEQYLSQLRQRLAPIPRTARDEYVNEIAEHVRESRTHESVLYDHSVPTILGRLGPPDVLAAAFNTAYRDRRTQARKSQRPIQKLRRWAPRIAGAVLVALFVAAFVWAVHYQPLYTAQGGVGGDFVTMANGHPAPTVPDAANVVDNPTIFTLTPGTSTIAMTVNLYNSDSIPITITGVASPFVGTLFGPAHVSLRPQDSLHERPFRPFTLGAHATEVAVVSVPMHCKVSPGETMETSQLAVSTSFFGVRHVVEVDIDPFYVLFAKSCS